MLATALLVAACSEGDAGTPRPVGTVEAPATPDAADTSTDTDTETAAPVRRVRLSEDLMGPGRSIARAFRAKDGATINVEDRTVVLGSRVADPSPRGRTGAPHMFVPKAIESEAAGRTVRVSVEARADAAQPSPAFAVAYSTNSDGNSGWTRYVPTADYQTYTLDYDVPAPAPGEDAVSNFDFIGLNADTTGSGGRVQVRSVVVDVLED